MRALAEFIMRGRMQATLVVVGSAALPLLFWLSAAAGSLVLLRRGMNDAFGILIWALLPAVTWWVLGDPSILLIMLGTLLLAQVLRASGSWIRTLLASVVLGVVFALVLGFSPKFGALIQTIPLPVMGGVSIVVFGLIAVAGAKIWVDNKVDFSQNKNLIVAAITLILGTGDFTLKFGEFALGGIGTATFGAIILYALLNRKG